MPLHPVLLADWLFTAIVQEDVPRVRDLLAQGANPNQKGDGENILLATAAFQGNAEIVQALVDAGADVHATNRETNSTPLEAASLQGSAKAAMILLDAGANRNVVSEEGETPLMLAVKKKRASLVKRLIAAGAEINAVDREGRTALSLAQERGAPQTILDALEKAGAQGGGRATIELAPRGSTSGWAQKNVDAPPPAPEEDPEDFAERRGVGTFDYNNTVVFVRGDVETVARGIHKVTQAGQWEKDIAGREVELPPYACFVMQLQGHPWSIVLESYGGKSFQTLAQQVSEVLKTNAMYYGVSDTAGVLEYTFYEDGRVLEYLSEGEGELTILSSLRKVNTKKNERDLEEFVRRVFWEQDLYEPGISFGGLVGRETPGNRIVVPPDEVVRRIDLLALPPSPDAIRYAAWKRELEEALTKPAERPRRREADRSPPRVVKQQRALSDEHIWTPKATDRRAMRGVRTFERDHVALLVRAPVAEVVASVRELRAMPTWKTNLL